MNKTTNLFNPKQRNSREYINPKTCNGFERPKTHVYQHNHTRYQYEWYRDVIKDFTVSCVYRVHVTQVVWYKK